MDPSDQSTAYLASVAGKRIEIINDLERWRSIRGRYDALVSMATIHHWQHIPWIALEARRTMKSGAYWFAVMEWFANTPKEFLMAMTHHPTRERYKCYEWAYPASAYVDLIQSVGFNLAAAVPLHYRRNVFRYPPDAVQIPDTIDQDALNDIVDRHLMGPNGTAEMFWAEVDARRRKPGLRLLTRPQVLVFQREDVRI